jgi:hypothetical protein
MSGYLPIWLRREGDYVVVLVEHKIDGGSVWVEVIREHHEGPFSHIIEPSGIESRLADHSRTAP